MPEIFGAVGGKRRSKEDTFRFEDSLKIIQGEVYGKSLSLSEVLDLLPDATFVIGLDNNITAWNKACEEMTGVLREDIVNKPGASYSIPFYGVERKILIDLVGVGIEELAKSYTNIKKAGNALYADTWVPNVYKGRGAYLWGVAAPLFDCRGKRIGAIESIRDITVQRNVENALKESEELFRSMAENTSDIVFRLNPDGAITYISKSVERILGFKPGEVVGKKFMEFISTDDLPKAVNAFNQRVSTQVSRGVELNLLIKGGGSIYAELSLVSVKGEGKNVEFQGIAHDLSQRKRYEDALKESEEKYRLVFDNAGDAVFIHSPDGKIISANKVAADRLGYTVDELESMSLSMIDDESFAKVIPERVELIKERGSGFFESVQKHRNGKLIPIEVNAKLINYKGNQAVLAICRDITERKKSEAELDASHKRLLSVLDSLDSLVYVADFNSYEILFINKYGRDIWGDISGKKCWQAIQEGQKGPCPFCTNSRLVTEAGVPTGVYVWEIQNTVNGRWYECRDQAIPWAGKALVRMEIATDITSRKKSEAALVQKEEKLSEINVYLENLLNYANAPIIVWDSESNIIRFNHAFEHLSGYSSEGIVGRKLEVLFPENSRKDSLRKIADTSGGEFWDSVEIPILCKGGTVRMALWNSANIYEKDNKTLKATIAQGVDITSRKNAEAALIDSEEKYRTVVETATDYIFMIDRDYKIMSINEATARLFGKNKNDVVGLEMVKAFPEKVAEKYTNSLREVFDSGKQLTEEGKISLKGKELAISTILNPVKDRNGNIFAVLGMSRDVTSFKAAEEALRTSEEKYKTLVENTADFIYLVDIEGRILSVNHAASSIIGLTTEDLIGKSIYELFPKETSKNFESCITGVFEEGIQIGAGVEFGSERNRMFLDVMFNPVKDKKGGIISVLIVSRNISSYKKAEAARDESEKKYRFISENIGDVIWLLDLASGKFTYVSPSVEKLRGFTAEEVLEQSLDKALTQESYRFVFENLPKRIESYAAGNESLKVQNSEIDQIRKDGSIVPTEVVTTLLKDSEGRVASILGVSRDITERKKAEAALESSEKKYRQVVETINEGIWTIDKNDNTSFVNPRMAEMFGYSIDEMMGKNIFSFLDEEGKPAAVSGLENRRKGIREDLDLVFLKKDKSRIYVRMNMSAIFNESGDYVGSIAGVQDITERRRTDIELTSAYNRMNDDLKYHQAIAKITASYLNIVDFEENTRNVLRILGELVNASGVHIFEDFEEGCKTRNTFSWSSEGLDSGTPIFGCFSHADVSSWRNLIYSKGIINSSNEQILPEDLRDLLAPKGIKSVLIMPIVVENKPYGFLAFDDRRNNRVWNDSEIKILETLALILSNAFERKIDREALLERNKQLELSREELLRMLNEMDVLMNKQKQLEKIKNEFLSITSHELRTPITPMKAQLQMVLKEYFGTLTAEQRKSLEMVLRNAVRLDNLIGDILDISKLESGNMKMVMEKCDIVEVVKNVVEMLRTNSAAKNIQLVMEMEAITPFIFDRDRITQVVINLVNNAIKFTDPQGIIKIKVINEKTCALIRVTDSGIGISREDQQRLFRPFVQVDSSPGRKHEGTGLGLAICKGIVANHGGEIGLISEPGKGSTFFFTLPYNSEKKQGDEMDLFSYNKDEALRLFGEEAGKTGYELVVGKKKELADNLFITQDGKLRYNTSLTDLEKQGYITRKKN